MFRYACKWQEYNPHVQQYLSNLHNKFHFIKCHINPLVSQFMIGFYNTFHNEITWINEGIILNIPFTLVLRGQLVWLEQNKKDSFSQSSE